MNYTDDCRTDNAMISVYPYRVQRDQIAIFAMTEVETERSFCLTYSKYKLYLDAHHA